MGERKSFLVGTCHLHGDVDCGKMPRLGADGVLYPGRIKCRDCSTIFCRNGLRKKFGILVEGIEAEQWTCLLCTGICCCLYRKECGFESKKPGVRHTHCHNFRSAQGQRTKRLLKRKLEHMEVQRKVEQRGEYAQMDPLVKTSFEAFCRLYRKLQTNTLNINELLFMQGREWSSSQREDVLDFKQLGMDPTVVRLVAGIQAFQPKRNVHGAMRLPTLETSVQFQKAETRQLKQHTEMAKDDLPKTKLYRSFSIESILSKDNEHAE